jgi:DNA-binding PadR family transcriptional regulator
MTFFFFQWFLPFKMETVLDMRLHLRYYVITRHIAKRHIGAPVANHQPSVLAHPASPLSETTFLILVSLGSGPKHGYAIMKEVETLSQGRVLLSTGTLYGAIKRLLADGWIHRLELPADSADGRDRKSYELTAPGRKVLQAETQRLRELVQIAAQRISEGA